MTLTDAQIQAIADALASALVCLASNPEFEAEERQIREALAILDVQVLSSGGDPV